MKNTLILLVMVLGLVSCNDAKTSLKKTIDTSWIEESKQELRKVYNKSKVENKNDVPFMVSFPINITLLYSISPIDVIPDFVPFIGKIDDAAVTGICLHIVK